MLSINDKAISIGAAQAREEANPRIVARSSMEADIIRRFARSARLSTYVDFGCWVGLLAEQALKDGDFERAVLVDAVPACLDRASARINRNLTPDARADLIVERHNIALVITAEARPFQVPVNDTSCAGFGQPGLTIDVQQTEVCSFLQSLNIDLTKTYLKIDLEGLDLKVATALHEAGMLPRVLHIEFATDADFDYLRSLLQGTYSFPEQRPGHAFYSMALSQERGVLIGFDPDRAYP